MQGILIDFKDSYTLNLWEAFRQVGLKLDIIRYEDIENIDIFNLKIDCLILSPGPYNPSNYPNISKWIQFFEKKIPIIGVCRGHQIIGAYYGHSIIRAKNPIHGVPMEISLIHNELFPFEKAEVMPYHSLVVSPLENSQLNIIAINDSNEIMGFKHRELPILSVQFHPESIGTKNLKEFFDVFMCFIKSSHSVINIESS
jgi:anthranilate synthase/aminodeoxychorismate synthase-like glutamine amidotransferase